MKTKAVAQKFQLHIARIDTLNSMTVLSKAVLCNHGPYIDFVDHPTTFDVYKYGWPARSLFENGIFFQFADSLAETYCDVTQTFSIFDPHTSIQLASPHEIRALSAQFLGWAEYITKVRGFDLDKSLQAYNIYADAALPCPADKMNGEDLRLDLVETATFIANRLAHIAHAKRVLLIDSI